ncbi:MAG: RNA polymerase factor sigma-54 [Planctomycetota bacterium]
MPIARGMARLGLQQGLRQRQDMVLAPRMLQAIEVLALARADLDGWLAEQAEGNEALLVEDAGPPERDHGPSRSRAAAQRATDDHHALLEAQPGRTRSLDDLVEEQLATREVERDVAEWVRFLVGCLDDGGLLAATDDELLELAESAGVPFAGARAGCTLLARAIAELQQLEPQGIGARTSVEALLLQLDPTDPDYALLCRLLEEFLVELARNRRPAVAATLGLELDELERLLDVLGQLETRPAAHLTGAAAPVVIPDVVALPEDDGTITVELSRGALPRVRIDPTAEDLLREKAIDSEARAYLREKVEKARWVTGAVEMRGATLLRVAESALTRQRRFMAEGQAGLRPLSMTEVAEELGLAVSTISRTVAGKSVQTPWGIVPLRRFFQTAASGSDGPGNGSGEGAATDAARERVRRLVEGEDPSAPLSDDAIASALADEGLRVARRTVAKYRGELGIPTSYRRRRHA